MGVVRDMILVEFIQDAVGLVNAVVLQPGVVDMDVPRVGGLELRLEGGREENEDEGKDGDDEDDGDSRRVTVVLRVFLNVWQEVYIAPPRDLEAL